MSDTKSRGRRAVFFVRPKSRGVADALVDQIADALIVEIDRDRASRGLAPLPERKGDAACGACDVKSS